MGPQGTKIDLHAVEQLRERLGIQAYHNGHFIVREGSVVKNLPAILLPKLLRGAPRPLLCKAFPELGKKYHRGARDSSAATAAGIIIGRILRLENPLRFCTKRRIKNGFLYRFCQERQE